MILKKLFKREKVLARGLHYRVIVIPFQKFFIDSSFNNLNPVPSIIDKKFFQYYRYFKLKVYKYLGMVGAIRQGFYRGFCKNSKVLSKSSCNNFSNIIKNVHIMSNNLKELLKVWYNFASKMLDFRV